MHRVAQQVAQRPRRLGRGRPPPPPRTSARSSPRTRRALAPAPGGTRRRARRAGPARRKALHLRRGRAGPRAPRFRPRRGPGGQSGGRGRAARSGSPPAASPGTCRPDGRGGTRPGHISPHGAGVSPKVELGRPPQPDTLSTGPTSHELAMRSWGSLPPSDARPLVRTTADTAGARSRGEPHRRVQCRQFDHCFLPRGKRRTGDFGGAGRSRRHTNGILPPRW